jgi:acyl carrier protein
MGDDWARGFVVNLLARHLDRDPTSIQVTDRLGDLLLDSLEWVSIIMELEDATGIDLPEDESRRIETVEDLIGLIQGR